MAFYNGRQTASKESSSRISVEEVIRLFRDIGIPRIDPTLISASCQSCVRNLLVLNTLRAQQTLFEET